MYSMYSMYIYQYIYSLYIYIYMTVCNSIMPISRMVKPYNSHF